MNTKWDEKYRLNISGVDEQHMRLFLLLEESEKFYSENKLNLKNNLPAVKNIITEIEQYSLTHFLMEERAMENTGYPDLEAHKELHSKFIKVTQKFLLKLDSEEILTDENKLDKFILSVLTFLSSWIINHIQTKDMEIKPYVKGL